MVFVVVALSAVVVWSVESATGCELSKTVQDGRVAVWMRSVLALSDHASACVDSPYAVGELPPSVDGVLHADVFRRSLAAEWFTRARTCEGVFKAVAIPAEPFEV